MIRRVCTYIYIQLVLDVDQHEQAILLANLQRLYNKIVTSIRELSSNTIETKHFQTLLTFVDIFVLYDIQDHKMCPVSHLYVVRHEQRYKN